MEGTSNKYPGKLNISRVHNWESGEYDKPIIITADYLTEFNVSQEKIDEIGIALTKLLKADIFCGEIFASRYKEKHEYDIKLLKTYIS